MKLRYLIIPLIIIFMIIVIVVVYRFETKIIDSTDNNLLNKPLIVDVTLETLAPLSKAEIVIGGIVMDTNAKNLKYSAISPEFNIEQKDSKLVPQPKFNQLTDLIIDNNFWSFDSVYRDTTLMDGTGYILTIRSIPPGVDPTLADPGSYSVSCYGRCPQEIIEIRKMIYDMWGEEILNIGM